jgi:hypothetical protein
VLFVQNELERKRWQDGETQEEEKEEEVDNSTGHLRTYGI